MPHLWSSLVESAKQIPFGMMIETLMGFDSDKTIGLADNPFLKGYAPTGI
jgi:hypothetical protein